MEEKKVIAICNSGGVFEKAKDGSLSYRGGNAQAIEIDNQMKFDEFEMEVAEMFGCSISTMSIKYFIPGYFKTLISISNDKGLRGMIKFHGDSVAIELYVMTDEILPLGVSNMQCIRRTTLPEALAPADASLNIVGNVVDDTNTTPDLIAPVNGFGDTDYVESHFDIPIEISPMMPRGDPNDAHLAKASQLWQNTITGVGQTFSGVLELRESLRKYAIAHQFAFRYKKNDRHRVTVKCKSDGCPWGIHALRSPTTQLICITKMSPTHTCDRSVATTGHQAKCHWVAGIIEEKLKVLPNYKTKDIISDIIQEYGIQLTYLQAWRAKEMAKHKEEYRQLPLFCEKIMKENPGSLVTFTTKDNSTFHRLFFSFHVSLFGFQKGCRPLLCLDSEYLSTKYYFFTAMTADGDNDCFPVAFAVVDSVTKNNWHWFLQQLKASLSISCPITFVADRQRKESISKVFPGSFHAFCLYNLTNQLSVSYHARLRQYLYDAATATTSEGFHECLERIKGICNLNYHWVSKIEPMNWANAFFQGQRYNFMSSNSLCFEDMEIELRDDVPPITEFVAAILRIIMKLIIKRRTRSAQWMSTLTPSMEDRLKIEKLKVGGLQVLPLAGSKYEVHSFSIDEVDMDKWSCSCKGWQITGIPCCHALAVILFIDRCPYDYCSRYLTTESYRMTYSENVHPIPNVDHVVQNIVTVTPPDVQSLCAYKNLNTLTSTVSVSQGQIHWEKV